MVGGGEEKAEKRVKTAAVETMAAEVAVTAKVKVPVAVGAETLRVMSALALVVASRRVEV